EYKPEITEMGAMELQMEVDMGEEYVIIDVRTQDEYKAGRIPGATHINFGLVPFRIGDHVEELDQEFIVVCKSGGRSTIATKLLQDMGYSPINLDGGFDSWMEAGYPVETDHGTFVKN
ncbi:MAG: rhodanese-like domain-containing protein, partial [Bacillota bacterium]